MQDDIKKLIIDAQQGDSDSFAVLVERFQNMAVGYAFSLLGDYMLAEDAAQDAFIKVYVELKNLRHPEAFTSWLISIIKTGCMQVIRKRVKYACSYDELPDVSEYGKLPEELVLRQELAESIWKAVSGLPEEYRTVFILKYIDNHSYKQISDAINITETDVTNRLYAARKLLRKELLSVLEENVRQLTVSKDFKNKVLQGIPKITFHIQKGGCPEDEALVSSIRALMEYMGEDYTKLDMVGRWPAIRLDYVFFMGITGAAFRMLWPRNKWDGSLWELLFASEKPSEPFKRAFDAAGYDCEVIWKQNDEDKELFIRKITDSIENKKSPVIARGVVGPPECCIIAGYNSEEDALLGWSMFQNQKKYSKNLKRGPGGYFAKKHWFEDTYGIITIGDKKQAPDIKQIIKEALNYGVTLMQMPLNGDFYSGTAAFKMWEKALANDDNFTGLSKIERYARMETHMTATSLVIEGHWYGSNFLRMAAAHIPEVSEAALSIAELMHNEHKLMYKCWEVLGGGPQKSQKKADLLVEHAIRNELAEYILQAGDCYEKAAQLMKQLVDRI